MKVRATLVAVLLVSCTASSAASRPPVTVEGSPVAPAVAALPKHCPSELPARLSRRAVPGVATTLVPGAPIVVVICVAKARTEITGTRVGRLVRALNHLDRVPPGTVYACPADFGPTFAMFFDYPDGDRLLVLVSASGCRFATNGRLSARADPRLLRRLRNLTQR